MNHHTNHLSTYLATALAVAFLTASAVLVLHYRDAVAIGHAAPVSAPVVAPAIAPRADGLRCQREEGGEVIGYPAGMTPRGGFPAVACPTGKGTVNDAKCVAIPFGSPIFGNASYDGAEWTAENGDGNVIGYAKEEDSTVYNTQQCVNQNPLYGPDSLGKN